MERALRTPLHTSQPSHRAPQGGRGWFGVVRGVAGCYRAVWGGARRKAVSVTSSFANLSDLQQAFSALMSLVSRNSLNSGLWGSKRGKAE